VSYVIDVSLYTLSNVFVLFLFLFELLDSGPFIMTSHQQETIITNDCDRHILHESFCFHNPFSLPPNHSETHSTSVYSFLHSCFYLSFSLSHSFWLGLFLFVRSWIMDLMAIGRTRLKKEKDIQNIAKRYPAEC
jgi:hypothetical protein